MADNDLITKIADIVIQQTVNQRIPTIVFLSDIETKDLVKNILGTIKGGNRDETTFTPEDWKEVADIMTMLSGIPLLLKKVTDINEMKADAEDFIKEFNNNSGLIIIDNKNLFPNYPFTNKENISIIVVKG